MITIVIDLLVLAAFIFGALLLFRSVGKLVNGWGKKDVKSYMTLGEVGKTAAEAVGISVGATVGLYAAEKISDKIFPASAPSAQPVSNQPAA